MVTENNYKFATKALHAGHEPDATTNARAVPIYQTTSYVFDSAEHAANLFGLKEFGNIYTRLMNPTTDVLEKRLAALDGGVGALVFASGSAAITAAVLNITKAGQNIVSSSWLYGGTYNLFHYTLPKLGIETRFVDSSDPENFAKAIDENTRLLYTESIGNPGNNVDDIEAIAAIAHKHNIPLVMDNTVSPMIFNPFEVGVDIITYSLTKFVGGHGNSIGGAIVDSGGFDWSKGNYPEITEPDPSYHGLVLWEAFGLHDEALIKGAAYILKARLQLLRDMRTAWRSAVTARSSPGGETIMARRTSLLETISLKCQPVRNMAWRAAPMDRLPDGEGTALAKRRRLLETAASESAQVDTSD